MEQQESLEKRMIKMIEETNKFLDEFESRLENGLQVILLIGITGAGKSTIFNFLAGAEFELKEDDDDLRVVQDDAQFSAMKAGMSSITRQPKYFFHDQYNHLLIDFPGFQDTRGELDKLMVQMLFFKIVTKIPIKVVFVLRHPENDLNDRGVGLQDFIKDQFNEQNLDSTNFTLILNSYGERLKDEILKLRLQKRLQERFNRANENIFVIRKIKDQNSLQSIINPEKREQLWQQLIKSNAIKFLPKLLPNSSTVSKYLKENSHRIIVKYCLTINENLNKNIMELSNQQIIDLNQSIKQLITVLKSNRLDDPSAWYLQYVETCELISKQLNSDDQIVNNSQDFLVIFEHFLQFKEFLDGFEECQRAGILAQSQCSSMLTLINMKLIQLEEKRKSQEEINIQQEILFNEEKKRNEIQQQFLLEMEKNKDNQEEIEKLQEEYQKLIKINEQQIQDYQKQLQQLYAEQKEYIEKRRKENEEKMNQLVQTINNLQQQFLKQEEQRRSEEQQRRQEREIERQERYRKDEELRRKDEEMRRREDEMRRREEQKNQELLEERRKYYDAQQKQYQQQLRKEEELKQEMNSLKREFENKRYELQQQSYYRDQEQKTKNEQYLRTLQERLDKQQRDLQNINYQNTLLNQKLSQRRGRRGCAIF